MADPKEIKDVRIDKLVTWAVGALASALLGVCIFVLQSFAGEFKEFKNEFKSEFANVKREVGDLKVEVARLQDQRREIRELKEAQLRSEERIRALEKK